MKHPAKLGVDLNGYKKGTIGLIEQDFFEPYPYWFYPESGAKFIVPYGYFICEWLGFLERDLRNDGREIEILTATSGAYFKNIDRLVQMLNKS